MKKLLQALVCSTALMMSAGALAAEQGNAEEATAMVKKAVAFLKANGKDKTLAEVSNNKGQFVDRELYIAIYDMNGKVIAHGTNAKLIGKDVSALKDADGKEFVKDILSQAKANGKGKSNYKWQNPVSKEIQAKSVYFEKSEDMIFSGGYYTK